METKISPSLLAADFLHLEDELHKAETSGAVMLHCDVMDGVYVPNISFGFDIIRQLGTVTSLPLDVHMMTSCPEKYIDVLKKSGASSVTLHSDVMPEAELIGTLKYIRSLGMKAAVSLKPRCPAEDILPFVEYVDMVLVMTVEPGFGGQKFMENQCEKIALIREECNKRGLKTLIQVDGGITDETIGIAAKAGADVFVAGSYVFKGDKKEAIEKLKAE